MKRLYRCAVIGDGASDDEFRPKVAAYGVAWAVYGEFTPGATAILVEVTADAAAHARIALDPDMVALP